MSILEYNEMEIYELVWDMTEQQRMHWKEKKFKLEIISKLKN